MSGHATRGPWTGDLAPSFTLPDLEGRRVDLAAKLRTGPVILHFMREFW